MAANKIDSFFAKEPKARSIPTLNQLTTAVEKAAACSLAIATERWPATHPSFKPNRGKAQSMNGGCGGLWMQIHGHSPAYGVSSVGMLIYQLEHNVPNNTG